MHSPKRPVKCSTSNKPFLPLLISYFYSTFTSKLGLVTDCDCVSFPGAAVGEDSLPLLKDSDIALITPIIGEQLELRAFRDSGKVNKMNLKFY